MKDKLITLIVVLLFPFLALAQDTNKRAPGFWIIKATTSSKEIITKHLHIDNSDISEIRVLPIQEVEKRFGKQKEITLVAEVTLQPGVEVSTLKEFYKNHNIQGNKRKLPFVVNGESITDAKDLIIIEKSIKILNIRTDLIELKTAGYLRSLENIKKSTETDHN